jgi:hypothetical protein
MSRMTLISRCREPSISRSACYVDKKLLVSVRLFDELKLTNIEFQASLEGYRSQDIGERAPVDVDYQKWCDVRVVDSVAKAEEEQIVLWGKARLP